MEDGRIHGVEQMAAAVEVSERTMWRWLELPEAEFVKRETISTIGTGGNVITRWTMVNSLTAFAQQRALLTSAIRSEAAKARWHGPNVSSFRAG